MVTANMATIPARVDILPHAIESIYDQVDLLRVYLNGFKDIPRFLTNDTKIQVFSGADLGATGKFYKASEDTGYYFSIDDDLVYPPRYVADHLAFLQKADDRVIVTLHGDILKPVVNDFYKDKLRKFHFYHDVRGDHVVHVGGTGVMAFNASVFRVDYREFLYPNMADVWIAKLAAEQDVPIVVREHTNDYLKYLLPGSKKTIYHRHKNDCRRETEIINSIRWPPRLTRLDGISCGVETSAGGAEP